jgi:protein-histidine pros-kinase
VLGRRTSRTFPWALLLGGSALLAAAVYAGFELLRRLQPEAAPLESELSGRSIVASGLVLVFVVSVLLRRLRHTEASEARFRALLESVPDPVVVLDVEGRIVLANSHTEATFGHRRGELVGAPVDTLLPERLRGKVAIRRARQTGEMVGMRKDGTEFPIEVHTAGSTTPEGEEFIATFRDLTERKRAEEERFTSLERLREVERLKELDAFKTQFINTAAHELNTPLTPIKLQLGMLATAGGELSEKQRRAVAVLNRNFDRLSLLVSDVLEVSRLQARRLGLQHEDVELNRVAAEAVESFQETARHRGLTLEFRPSPEPLRAQADPRRLTQVLFNLLSNAMKFTPRGGKVVVSVERQHGAAMVQVQDTGRGIRPEDLGKLFHPFTQVHDRAEVGPGGTGLGLYISRGLVELHGGRIWAESEGLGRGSTFALSIPFEAPVQDVEPPLPEAATPADRLAERVREVV